MNSSHLARILELRFFDCSFLYFSPLRGLAEICPHFCPHVTWSRSLWASVSLHLDHIYPFETPFFNCVIFVNCAHESDKLLFSSTLQKSSIRCSCMTSRLVWVDLVTSMYPSGQGKVSCFGTKSWTRGSVCWRYMKYSWIVQQSFPVSASSAGTVGGGSSDSPWDSPLESSLHTESSRLRVVSRNSLSLPDNFAVHLLLGKQILLTSVISVLLLHWFVAGGSLMLPFSPILPYQQSGYLLSKFSAINAYPWNVQGKTFVRKWWRLDWSFVEIGWYSTIALNDWSLKGFSESSSIGYFPIRQ